MRNEILQGDVIDIIKILSAESINCIITSPPYFGLRDYGLPPTHWPEVAYAPMAGLSEIIIPAMSCCFGLEDTIEAYVGHMVLVWRGLWRVLRGDGVGFLNLGDSYSTGASGQNFLDPENKRPGGGRAKNEGDYGHIRIIRNSQSIGLPPKNLIGIPWRCAFALQADGWYLRSDVIWAKMNPMPESVVDRPTKAHEYVFLLAKSERYWWDQEAIREPHKKDSLKRYEYGLQATAPKDGYISAGSDTGAFKCERVGDHINYAGRNKRTVWSIATKPFPSAHFAVMPEALVEPCLLAGCPAQVCTECGEPWVRVVEREKGDTETITRPKAKGQAGYGSSTSTLSLSGNGSAEWDKRGSKTKTIAHTPTCQHSAPTRPGITLDPFFGSGTVGVVAKKFKRDWAGIELNPDYIKLARTRLDQTQPALFAR
jgi:DNA modification methylase